MRKVRRNFGGKIHSLRRHRLFRRGDARIQLGIRVYLAEASGTPEQIQPPSSPRRYWTRRGLAECLCEELGADTPTVVGIDHGFSFPIEYFNRHSLPRDWPSFLLDFQKRWPTHEPHMYIDFIRHGKFGEGQKRMGESNWLRLTERWTATAKSVFMFDVQGSVARSTFAGLPWLLYLKNWCKRPAYFWPFDGWEIPQGKSVVVEVYPALWMRRFDRDGRDGDEHAAYVTAAWLQRADRDGTLASYLNPSLTPEEREVADIEGWILGVV
jgi:hypothetical protein